MNNTSQTSLERIPIQKNLKPTHIELENTPSYVKGKEKQLSTYKNSNERFYIKKLRIWNL